MDPVNKGIIGCLALLLLLLIKMPVGFAMTAIGLAGFAWVINCQAALSMATTNIFETFSSHSLTVIPLFIFMGQIAFHSGISKNLFRTAYAWLGSLPGGLAMATVGACTGFGAICGSGPATAATMSAVALPEMKKYNYDMELAAGAVASGGSLGMLIPPSVVFIVYAIMTGESVGSLFIAGIIPGLMIATLFCLTIYINCKRHPHFGPACPNPGWHERFKSLLGVSETLVLFIIVIGGLFLGFFTPTEAAAVGAAGSLAIAAFKKTLTFKMLLQSLMETIRTSCMVMMIVTGAVVFGKFLAVTRIPIELASWLTSLPLSSWIVIVFIIIFYLLAGCFVDALALVLLTIPIFAPVVTELGYNLVWFGVIIVVVTQMGVISPPVGVCAYIVNGVAKDIPLQKVFKGCIPFLIALIISAAILVAFPQISLFLPALFGK